MLFDSYRKQAEASRTIKESTMKKIHSCPKFPPIFFHQGCITKTPLGTGTPALHSITGYFWIFECTCPIKARQYQMKWVVEEISAPGPSNRLIWTCSITLLYSSSPVPQLVFSKAPSWPFTQVSTRENGVENKHMARRSFFFFFFLFLLFFIFFFFSPLITFIKVYKRWPKQQMFRFSLLTIGSCLVTHRKHVTRDSKLEIICLLPSHKPFSIPLN